MIPQKRSLLITLFALLLLAACQEAPAPTDTPAPAGTATTAATATSRPPATDVPATATMTPPPSPTPIVPAIRFEPQAVDDEGIITVAQAVIDAPGWIVLRNSDGTIVGTVPLPPGNNEAVVIEVDPLALGATVTAALLYDRDHEGALDLPEGDPAVIVSGTPVQATATITLEIPLPEIRAANQAVGADGLILIDRVIAPGPGWLAVFADVAGEPGALLAYSAISGGRSEDVTLQLNMFQATPRVHILLFADAGETGRFEPEFDPPVLILGAPLQLDLDLSLPPDIFILDQPIIDDMLYVEHVIAPEPGWLAIYQDEDGFPSRVIGFVYLEAGWNANLIVPVVQSLVTPLLHAHFHTDTEAFGLFGFPNGDPVLLINNQVPQPFTFSTEPGNYLISENQPLQDGGVIVTRTVLDAGAWLVVYADEAGELGEMLGHTWVPAGVGRDIFVPAPGVGAGDTVHLLFHLDGGELDLFEYPGGPDIPLQRGGQLIQLPILILPVS